jgi:hypothetical protein
MARGFLPGVARLQSVWIKGVPEREVFSGGLKTQDKEMRTLELYRCDKCGYVESYASDLVL